MPHKLNDFGGIREYGPLLASDYPVGPPGTVSVRYQTSGESWATTPAPRGSRTRIDRQWGAPFGALPVPFSGARGSAGLPHAPLRSDARPLTGYFV